MSSVLCPSRRRRTPTPPRLAASLISGFGILAVVLVALAATAGTAVASPPPLLPVALEVLSDGRPVLLDRYLGPVVVAVEGATYRPLIPDLRRFVPVGLAVDRGGEDDVLYVAMERRVGQQTHFRVVALDLSGQEVDSWSFYRGHPLRGMTGDFERRRLLFVGARAVYALDLDRRNPTPDRVARVFDPARFTAAVPYRDGLLITDSGRGLLLAADADGEVRKVATLHGMPRILEQAPGSDDVLILDELGGRVLRLRGDSVEEVASLESWEGPVDLATDGEGRLWVADPWEGTLTRLGRDGTVDRRLTLAELTRR